MNDQTNATLQDLLTEYNVEDTPMKEDGELAFPTNTDLFDTPAPSVDVRTPTIASSAVLVTFNRSIPSFIRKDKEGAKRNDAATGAKRGVHRGTKKIIDCPEHDAMVKCGNDFYQYHMRKTVAWKHAEQMLHNNNYKDYRAEDLRVMGGKDRTGIFYTELVPAFLDAYPHARQRAAREMGAAFDPTLYPSVWELQKSIRMEVVYEPVPTGGDFRLDIPAEAQQEMRETYEKAMQQRVQTMAQSMWKRLLKPLKNMSEKLDYDDEGKPRNGNFQRTIVQNVTEIVDLMRDCNFNNDPDMTRVQQELRVALTGVNADMLKASPSQRIKTKEDVDRIIKSLPTFGF
tara:strand:- start:1656 stop:2684 length:1029 start_codon:yes stop_codon:yes gene_type:complete